MAKKSTENETPWESYQAVHKPEGSGHGKRLPCSFRELVQERAANDAKFRTAFLTETIDAMLSGEPEVAKIMLRDYINATITFPGLAEGMKRPAETIQRMFAPKGSLRLGEFSKIMKILQSNANIKIQLHCRDEIEVIRGCRNMLKEGKPMKPKGVKK